MLQSSDSSLPLELHRCQHCVVFSTGGRGCQQSYQKCSRVTTQVRLGKLTATSKLPATILQCVMQPDVNSMAVQALAS